MATRTPKGSARSRGGRADAVHDEFESDEPLAVILPTPPPGGRPAGRAGTGGTGGSARGGSGSGRGSASSAARSGGSTAARSGNSRGARGGRGGGTGRSGKKGGRGGGKRGAASRRRKAKQTRNPIVILARWLFRTVMAAWMVVAGTVGFAVRHIGRSARDLHPDHQRDGLGLVCLGLAIVFAAGVWVRMDNAAGRAVYDLTSGALGEGAFTIPVLLTLLGWRFMRHPERNSETSRAVIGWVALLIGLLGLIHIAKGTPRPADGVLAIRAAGGLVGYAVSAPLVTGLTPWVATPLLGLVACFGLLVITGTPVRQVPARLRELGELFGYPSDPRDENLDAEGEEVGGRRRGVRGEIARAIRLRPSAIEAGEHVKPYDTPVLGPGGKRQGAVGAPAGTGAVGPGAGAGAGTTAGAAAAEPRPGEDLLEEL